MRFLYRYFQAIVWRRTEPEVMCIQNYVHCKYPVPSKSTSHSKAHKLAQESPIGKNKSTILISNKCALWWCINLSFDEMRRSERVTYYSSFLQYLAWWHSYSSAITFALQMPKYRTKAKEIARERGLLDDHKKKKMPKVVRLDLWPDLQSGQYYPAIFYQPALRSMHSQLVLRLLFFFCVCWFAHPYLSHAP